jgi:hypothetical protein
VGIGNRGNYNYTYGRNFIYCYSHVEAFDCGMFVSDLCIVFVSWHGSYIVVTCPAACDFMDANEYQYHPSHINYKWYFCLLYVARMPTRRVCDR